MRLFPIIAALGLVTTLQGPSAAKTILRADCRVVLEEEQQDLEAVALRLDLARSELVAAEEVFHRGAKNGPPAVQKKMN